MERQIGEFLLRYKDTPCQHAYLPERERCAVIVETRDAFFLPLVIKNAMHMLPDWNLQLFAPAALLNTVHRLLPECAFKATEIDCSHMHVQQYSQLLTSRQFWNAIDCEHILIFQLDTVLLRPLPTWISDYSMVGAPCGFMSEDKYILNGGLSYRKKSAMLLCIEDCVPTKEAEDIFFTRRCRELKLPLPRIELATEFASESLANPKCCGIHGTNKYWLSSEDIKTLIKHGI